MRSIALLTAVLATAGAVAAPVESQGAQRANAPAADSAESSVVVDSASPRASVLGFLNAARADDHARAALWLDRRERAAAARASELASRLSEVLDAHLWLDLERVSPRAVGDTTDGLPHDQEFLGTVPDAEGRPAAICLRVDLTTEPARWLFTAGTVARIDSLYAALPHYWAR